MNNMSISLKNQLLSRIIQPVITNYLASYHGLYRLLSPII